MLRCETVGSGTYVKVGESEQALQLLRSAIKRVHDASCQVLLILPQDLQEVSGSCAQVQEHGKLRGSCQLEVRSEVFQLRFLIAEVQPAIIASKQPRG